MVKFIISRDYGGETSKYTREYNTYGVREELLYPIEMNDSSLKQPQPDANLATYLIKFQLFKKSNVRIKKNGSKGRFFKSFFYFGARNNFRKFEFFSKKKCTIHLVELDEPFPKIGVRGLKTVLDQFF